MGLADELEKASDMLVYSNWQKCAVYRLRSLLDPADQPAFEGLIANRDIVATKVVDFLRHYATTLEAEDEQTEQLRGLCLSMGSATIQRHRRGSCSCGGKS